MVPKIYRLFAYYLSLTVWVCLLLVTSSSALAQSLPSISNITDNLSTYQNNQIPKYEKLEITFQVDTVSSNFFYPYDSAPPAGIESTGITINAIFTDPDANIFRQPGFYYQTFEDQVKAGKEWFYPTDNFTWKIRFSPNKTGFWKYKIIVEDANGITESLEKTFVVGNSNSKGFLKVSSSDSRYFEYDDGTYFPALGYNINGGDLDNVNPVLGNINQFQIMGENGIELSRVWISQFSIYSEAWGKWGSPNRVHQTQEPRMGIVNPVSSLFANYPNLTAPSLPVGSEYYMWLEFNEAISADGNQYRFSPCRSVSQIPVKQNTNYRVRVRYKDVDIEGPRVSGQPYGFAVKTSTNMLAVPTGLCNEPNAGTVIAATYNQQQVSSDPQNPDWSILEATFNSGASDYIHNFYLTFQNAKSQDADQIAGHVFIDKVWLEEEACSFTDECPNLLSKPWMSMHRYINQRDAYSFDKLLDLAGQYGIYLKAVMLEKNDRIFQSIDFNGQPIATGDDDYFYGDGRVITKVRWLQQAWWRYMQARWGYSPNIHSWELLNEGDPGNNKHWVQADEFAKFMKCRVFDEDPIADLDVGNVCRFDHPNSHMVTTSFWGGSFPWKFWNNSDKLYADIDYADQHLYATEGVTDPAQFNDSAYFSYWLSSLSNNFAQGKRKPFIRGETAWNFTGTNLLETNADGGQWLHDFIWAGINHGGLMEHFFGGSHFTRQIYNLNANPPYDHRPMFGTYYRFIKDIPLNNGHYQDVSASVSSSNIRVFGQKDLVNSRAHIWVQNIDHTWKNVVDAVNILPVSGNVTIGGFSPNTNYKLERWDTYSGSIASNQNVITDGAGILTLSVSNLTTDTAYKIGDYSPVSSTPTPATTPGDANADGQVDEADFQVWFIHYNQNTLNGSSDADFNSDGKVDGTDYVIWLNNY